MKLWPKPKRYTHCVYCGVPTRGPKACSTHVHLLKNDPQYMSEQKR